MVSLAGLVGCVKGLFEVTAPAGGRFTSETSIERSAGWEVSWKVFARSITSNLENLTDHFASKALISSLVELDELEDNFFLAGSLHFSRVVSFFSVVTFCVALPMVST